jgi:hypothetical protein
LEKVVIFGAGVWGNTAYHYCKNKYEVIAYVDNNPNIWNTFLNGIPVKSPDFLFENKVMVVLANLKYEKSIKEQLLKEYGIEYILKFSIVSGLEETREPDQGEIGERELIVSYYGGLGNQMFIYALYRFLQSKGKNVRADLLSYYTVNSRDFVLTKVFPNTNICRAHSHNIKKYRMMAPYMEHEIGFQYYIEPSVMGGVKSFADERLMDNNLEWGYLQGYFQTKVFAQEIEDILRREYTFGETEDARLQEIVWALRTKNAVAVHIRRGDYLDAARMYGGICTEEYYQEAMRVIKEKVEKPIFYFFSNDIEWVKDNFCEEDAVYIESQMFDDYQDWYDMYLTSECKHNIIANSSFSWWGAWLNQNKNKIVIAPKRWVNADSMEDIYLEEWMRI